ncbi:MAG TPA: type II secretion system F family protein [Candidatus Nanoarchaeia archaeon]|nr:type II secretion system F family protein [Candidatus Nanoarchaeia archaeon]
MNLLNIFPEKFQKKYIRNLKNAGIKKEPHDYFSKNILLTFILSLLVGIFVYFVGSNSGWFFLGSMIVLQVLFYMNLSMKATSRISKMEKMFPDFLQLMSSNLRAGMTVERSFISSARPELNPLDEEIKETGREVATGKDITNAFREMSKRIDSEEIKNIISLIISGLRTGGDISSLLQTISSNMREKEHLEKKASSNVTMYVIFIFVAVAIGAPVLFGLSSILVEVILNITGNLPGVENAQMSMPLTFSGVDISVNFVIYFSITLIVVTDFISSMLLGLVNKGSEKYGLKYLFPLLAVSMALFFGVRAILSGFVEGMFSSVF